MNPTMRDFKKEGLKLQSHHEELKKEDSKAEYLHKGFEKEKMKFKA